jgi:general secretion pathway protein I
MHPDLLRMKTARGFTLIETVVALLVVALGMTAVYMQIGQFATTAIVMQDRTLASWIGSNVVTELSLATEWPELGDSEEEVEYANRLWLVTIEITETEIENLRRADVSVALADRPERVIHQVSGLIEPPIPPNFPPVNWISVGRGPGG